MSNDIIHDIRKITWNTPEHQVLDKVGKLKRKFGIDNDLIGRVFERIEKVRKQEKANRKILSRRSSEGYFDE
jgi:chorismate mutase